MRNKISLELGRALGQGQESFAGYVLHNAEEQKKKLVRVFAGLRLNTINGRSTFSPTAPSTSQNLIIFCGPIRKVSSLPCPSKRSERNISPSRAKASFIIRRNYILLGGERARARSLLCLHSLNIITARSQNQICAENYINDDPSAAKSLIICLLKRYLFLQPSGWAVGQSIMMKI